jgi:phage-related holin
MRNQFFSKMLTYLLLIIVSGVGDKVITLTHRPEFLLNVVVTYISSTELLSCLENLNDANVSMATALMNQVKIIAHIDNTKETK